MSRFTPFLLTAFSLASAITASAHLSYPEARNFGILTGVGAQTLTVTGQTARRFSWADGTDANFGRQDDTRYLRFSLEVATEVTISITSLDTVNLLPAFTVFAGVGHGLADPVNLDYDTANVTLLYLNSLGGVTKEGSFTALQTMKIGNDLGTTLADLAVLTYVGHAADGTAANYGNAAGINGDGVADGYVNGTFLLQPGIYTLAVGGADYNADNAITTGYGFTATVSTVPEPSCALLIATAATGLATLRRRSASGK